MKKFEALEKKNTNEIEREILEKWQKEDILKKTIENRKENFVFYDGPAYANGMPGIHHMLAKLLKDSFCKYKTMQGYRVLRKIGWDTHGLPIEVNVEKKLGFSGKKDIEDFGIENFNEKCRESIRLNEDAFVDLTNKMGQFIDTKDPYITCKNSYIETEWWILKKFFDAGLIYNGYKVMPYCIRCGTELSTHEVAQEYKEISVNTVTVPLKLKDEDTYLLVWTTTPWTLIANVAACVNPNEKYIKALSKGYKFILADSLASKVLGDDYEVLETYLGKDLEGKEYEQLMPFVSVENAFKVVCADYVTTEDGTGIVHIAPAFGADDYEVSKKYNLPVIKPVDESGKYTEGIWSGRSVLDSELEIDIIKWLKENDKLFKKEKIKHNYPHCWRCKTPLLYYAKPSWYIKTTAYKDKVIEANKKINWHPSYIGEKRFANWLENMNDWGISRNRYWGTPLPLWTCECGHLEMIGSIDELVSKSIENIDHNIDLHRPYVDDIHIKCEKCGKVMNRVSDVLDVWFDSGAMPYAQYHYPFENKELFETQFPADFIAEGVDQTRGWFYVLLIISTFISGKSAYKNVLVNDLLLDKHGQKMHKSRGNAIEPFSIIEKYGADTVRWYMPYVSPVWVPIKFDEEGLKEIYSKYISTLRNTYSFFEMYANADNIDPREYNVELKDRHLTDRWLISKLNTVLKEVTDGYENYDLTKVVRCITSFINDDLSNWYIRSNRRRFWASLLTQDKKAVYQTTYEVLLTLTKMVAPITPFISEEIYTKLTSNLSVHLEDFPTYDESKVDVSLHEKMDIVRDVCSLGRFAREEAKIKVRQPLNEIFVPLSCKDKISELEELIKEELNIKKITYTDDLNVYVDYQIKPNYKVVGKVFGSKIKEFENYLKNLNDDEIFGLRNGDELNFNDMKITNEMVLINAIAKDGYYSASSENVFVILNTKLTDELISEGIARELVRKVQSMRKDLDLVITDRIVIKYTGSAFDMVSDYLDYIKEETLADEIIKTDEKLLEFDINGLNVGISIEKN